VKPVCMDYVDMKNVMCELTQIGTPSVICVNTEHFVPCLGLVIHIIELADILGKCRSALHVHGTAR
jgi:hypothetical protein